MKKQLERYINQQIYLIYLDRNGLTTKRTVRLLEIKNDQVKAYCLTKRAPRVFTIANILAIHPVVNPYVV